jgi:hypothetical protein
MLNSVLKEVAIRVPFVVLGSLRLTAGTPDEYKRLFAKQTRTDSCCVSLQAAWGASSRGHSFCRDAQASRLNGTQHCWRLCEGKKSSVSGDWPEALTPAEENGIKKDNTPPPSNAGYIITRPATV